MLWLWVVVGWGVLLCSGAVGAVLVCGCVCSPLLLKEVCVGWTGFVWIVGGRIRSIVLGVSYNVLGVYGFGVCCGCHCVLGVLWDVGGCVVL